MCRSSLSLSSVLSEYLHAASLVQCDVFVVGVVAVVVLNGVVRISARSNVGDAPVVVVVDVVVLLHQISRLFR